MNNYWGFILECLPVLFLFCCWFCCHIWYCKNQIWMWGVGFKRTKWSKKSCKSVVLLEDQAIFKIYFWCLCLVLKNYKLKKFSNKKKICVNESFTSRYNSKCMLHNNIHLENRFHRFHADLNNLTLTKQIFLNFITIGVC